MRPLEVEAGPQWVENDLQQQQQQQQPQWQLLYDVPSGTWVDVPFPELADNAVDLQLLAVRFVDPGHPERNLGPRYRVWLRNNGKQAIATAFNVLALASNSDVASGSNPQATVRINSMQPRTIEAVDIRLPMSVASMSRDGQGRAIPFTQLHVVVDSHRELTGDAIPLNNGVIVPRDQILSVDPAIFSADSTEAAVGSLINLAGEGFGPEPGQVVVSIGDLQLDAQIEGWYDLGIRLALPDLQLADVQDAKILVIRGDSIASNPIAFTLLPKETDNLPAAAGEETARTERVEVRAERVEF